VWNIYYYFGTHRCAKSLMRRSVMNFLPVLKITHQKSQNEFPPKKFQTRFSKKISNSLISSFKPIHHPFIPPHHPCLHFYTPILILFQSMCVYYAQNSVFSVMTNHKNQISAPKRLYLCMNVLPYSSRQNRCIVST